MKILVFIILLFIPIYNVNAQIIDLYGFEEISFSSYTSFFKPRTGTGVNIYLFREKLRLGFSYQYFNDKYIDKINYDGYIRNQKVDAEINMSEINLSLCFPHKKNKLTYGAGMKPTLHYYKGNKYTSRQNYPFNNTIYGIENFKEITASWSFIYFLHYSNFLNKKLILTAELQSGAVIYGIYPIPAYYGLFNFFSPFTRLNIGIAFHFNKKKYKF